MSLKGLLLGAGASYEAGMPLVADLTKELKIWLTPEKLKSLNTTWRTHGNGYSDSVIEDLVSILESPDMHYEAILGYLETQFRRHPNTLQHEYHALYSWLVEMVYYIIYYRQVNNEVFLNKNLSKFDGFRTLAEANNPLWIFSLNHDVMIEVIAARLSIPLHSGFGPTKISLPCRYSSGIKKREIQAEVLTKDDLELGVMYFPNPPQTGIHLLKIHGALDVFTFNDGKDLIKLLPSDNSQKGVIDALRAANEELDPLLVNKAAQVKIINEIIYTDDNGEIQFLRRSLLSGAFKFDRNKSQVLPVSLLKHFRQNLNFVSTLVCIGYGFGDLHINLILREWLEFSATRRIEIVSPSTARVPSFLLHLSLQVTIIKKSTTEYLSSQ